MTLIENESKKITVAITTYDRTNLLREAIESVINQTYKNIEIIVGNDNIGRNVEDLFPDISDSRIIWINNEAQLGYVENFNNMVNVASGDYFISLSDDDLLHPSALESMLELTNECEVNCVFSDYETNEVSFKDYTHKLNNKNVFTGEQWILAYLKRDIKAIGCYGLFSIDFMRSIGGTRTMGCNARLSPYGDNLFAIQAALLSKIGYIRAPLLYFRVHGGSPSNTSMDYYAFSSAQVEFINVITPIMAASITKRADFEIAMSSLLKWFIVDYTSVMSRSGRIDYRELASYLKFTLGKKNTYYDKVSHCIFFISTTWDMIFFPALKNFLRKRLL